MFKYNLLRHFGQQKKYIAPPPINFAKISTTSWRFNEIQPDELDRALEKPATLNDIFNQFTADQKQKILDIVNGDNAEKILSYDIAKTRATKLLSWKKRNGPMKGIEDILMVDGFSTKAVDKFYKSMFEENRIDAKEKRTPRQRTAAFITPVIDVDQRQEVRTCCALRVGVSSVTWARLALPADKSDNVPCVLTHWQHHEITEKKLHLDDLIKRILYVDHLVPNADVYLFEDPPMAQINSNPGSANQQNVNIQKCQVIAVLAYALSKRRTYTSDDDMQFDDTTTTKKAAKNLMYKRPNVFYLRRFLAARLFSQLVGTERVSSEDSILQLMRTQYNVLDGEDENGEKQLSFRGHVQFSQEHREMFSQAERYHREFLGQSLLINLAFVRLLLLQDERSIAVVTRQPCKAAATEVD